MEHLLSDYIEHMENSGLELQFLHCGPQTFLQSIKNFLTYTESKNEFGNKITEKTIRLLLNNTI